MSVGKMSRISAEFNVSERWSSRVLPSDLFGMLETVGSAEASPRRPSPKQLMKQKAPELRRRGCLQADTVKLNPPLSSRK